MTVQYILLVLSITNYAFAQVGRSCKFEYTGTTGTCKLSTDCPKVKKQAEQGIRPIICGYGPNSLPIVCCEGGIEANENSFLNSDYNSNQDGFIYPEDTPSSLPLKLSEQKCNEYSKPISGEVQILPLIAGAVPTSINITKCDYDGVALIVGGTPALLGEFPFMAAVGFRDADNEIKWNCGGTLVSERFVMTAGHCSNTRSFGPPVVVRLGELDLSRTDDGATPVDYDIERIIKHPEYKSNLKYNDIALIKLRKTVTFSKYIRPACLWNSPNVKQSTAIATGWGRTEQGGDTSDKLLKVSLNIMQRNRCQKIYENARGLPNGIVDSMVCAGELKGGKDTCQGDSGGPLFVTKDGNQCIFYVVGVTSFGKNCAAPNTPAIYTRVSSHIPWIERTIW